MTRSQRNIQKQTEIEKSTIDEYDNSNALRMEKTHLRFNHSIMSQIAMYYVLLHSSLSPQQEAINKMNCVIYNNDRFKEIKPTVNNATSIDIASPLYHTVPIMAMLSRTILKNTRSPICV